MLDKMARKFRAKMFEQYLSSYLREQNVSAVILFADGQMNQAIIVKHITLVEDCTYSILLHAVWIHLSPMEAWRVEQQCCAATASMGLAACQLALTVMTLAAV